MATNTPRKYKVTPTPRQRRAAQIIVDSATGKRPDIKSAGDIVAASGFGTGLQTQPGRVLNSVGVRTHLRN